MQYIIIKQRKTALRDWKVLDLRGTVHYDIHSAQQFAEKMAKDNPVFEYVVCEMQVKYEHASVQVTDYREEKTLSTNYQGGW